MEKLAKKIINEASEYRERALESFMPENTKALGRTILFVSILLILIFSNTIDVTEGTFSGFKIDLNESNRAILLIVVLVILIYYATQYLFDYFLYIRKWRVKNSFKNQGIKELIKQLETIALNNSTGLINALKTGSKDIDKYLTRNAQITKIDQAISSYIAHNNKIIKRIFRYRRITELIPIFLLALAMVFAFKFYYSF